ncbi:hypothetical protein P9112_002076 [Eukaryota sp. TZLM1-RC]
MSSSTSSSDNDSCNITFNPFSSINHYNYLAPSSFSTSKSPTPSSSDACEFQELFYNLDSLTPPTPEANHSVIFRCSSSEASSDLSSDSDELVSKVSSRPNLVVPPGKAPSRNIDSLSLETSPDLDIESGLVDADCAYADGGVTQEASELTKNCSSDKISGSKKPLKKHRPPTEPLISLDKDGLNNPLDKKLLHLKIIIHKQTFLHGMVDTGATISCISKDLIKKAKLFPTNNSLKVGLADRTKIVCPLSLENSPSLSVVPPSSPLSTFHRIHVSLVATFSKG